MLGVCVNSKKYVQWKSVERRSAGIEEGYLCFQPADLYRDKF